jgi:hypothetical protein
MLARTNHSNSLGIFNFFKTNATIDSFKRHAFFYLSAFFPFSRLEVWLRKTIFVAHGNKMVVVGRLQAQPLME